VDACAACHIPHRYQRRLVADTASNGVAPQPARRQLALYRLTGQRPTFTTDRYTPGPSSLVCLGCHDGTIASSTIGSSHALLAGVRAGFDLTDGVGLRDHPIGVPYPTDRGEYRSPGYAEARGVALPEGRIECVSCHNPHVATPGMLVMSNRRSALCLACHVK
jgi:predicted CXXCH cytochrome family protein